MSQDSQNAVSAIRRYYQADIDAMVRLMKTEGGSLKGCVAELRALAGYVSAKADGLQNTWASTLPDAGGETRGENRA